jgi:hypothetical protein
MNKKVIENLGEVMNESKILIQGNAKGPKERVNQIMENPRQVKYIFMRILTLKSMETFHSMYQQINYNISNTNGRLKYNYFDSLYNFIRKSIKMANILSTSDISNYDFIDDMVESDEKDYILNKRVQISKFYSKIILKFLLEDIKSMIIKSIRNN